MAEIRVDSQAMEQFKQSFITAGEEYKANLVKLTNLINEITKGNLQGPPAEDLLRKFEEKRATFNSIAQLIDDGERYMGAKQTAFTDMLGEIKGSMK